MLRLAFGQIKIRPMAFLGLAVSLFLAVTAVTLFGTLVFASFDAPPGTADQPGLALLGGAFGEIAILAALFVVANTLGFAIRQQHRDLALLRTVAATPGQVRRLVRWEVLVIVLLVSPPSWLAGTAGARWFVDELTVRDLIPYGVRTPHTPFPMMIASAITLLIGMASAAVAARRITRITPSEAMAESGTPAGGLGWIRGLLGLAVLGAGIFFCVFISTQPPDKAGQGALLAAMMLLAAVALLGPVLARAVVRPLAVPLRALAPKAGWLAGANLTGYAHRLSAAIVPIALFVGLSTTFMLLEGTVTDAAERLAGTDLASVGSAGDVWLRQMELIMLLCFGGVATVNTLAALTAERRREFALLSLIGSTRRGLIRMLWAETVLTTAAGVLVGSAVAAAAATTFSVTLPGGPLPSIDPVKYGLTVAGAAALAVLGVLVTGIRATRGSATALVAGFRG